MKITKHRWTGLGVGIAVFLAAFGVALAAVVVQVSREVPSTLTMAQVLSDENLGLYWDQEGRVPVTSLDFPLLQSPLDSAVPLFKTIYIRNESDIELNLVAPCGDVFD